VKVVAATSTMCYHCAPSNVFTRVNEPAAAWTP
jgi:hypothetical protein